jgi:hypothetical protein
MVMARKSYLVRLGAVCSIRMRRSLGPTKRRLLKAYAQLRAAALEDRLLPTALIGFVAGDAQFGSPFYGIIGHGAILSINQVDPRVMVRQGPPKRGESTPLNADPVALGRPVA